MNKAVFTFNCLLVAGLTFSPLLLSAEEPDGRSVVHDERGNPFMDARGNCVRTDWQSGYDECDQVVRVKRSEIDEADRTVYFEFNKARLLEGERHKLDTLVGTLKSNRDIKNVSIVGYADRKGSAAYNDKLSQKRAQTVENYLRKRGYLNTSVAKTRWLGESAPVTHCPDSLSRNELIQCLQRDRRVTVEIRYEDDSTSLIRRQ